MHKKILTILFFVFWAVPSFAQVDTAWVRRYNGPGNNLDSAVAIAVDNWGNVYVTGVSIDSGTHEDYATIKYEPDGDTAWVRRYNGPVDSSDCAYAIAVDDSGNVYVTGESDGSETYRDYATIKYDPQGNQLWVRRYNGPGNDWDYARAIAVDGSGNVYVTGYSHGSGTLLDYATIKYDPQGNQLWVRRYDGPGDPYDYDFAYAIAVDGSGNVYVTGESDGSGTSEDYATIKYEPDGDTAWIRRYNGPENDYDYAYAIAVDGSGNVYVTGGSCGTWGIDDYATIKYDPDGNELWVRRYDGPENSFDYAYAIAVDGSNNVYVTGASVGSGTYYDYATIKYDPQGNQLWVRRYNGPVNEWDYAYAIAVDGSGNVYVTGYSWERFLDMDYATIKYDPQGNQLWVRRYSGPGDGASRANAIAVDDSNNVYVTGGSYSSETRYDYATIKYWQNHPPNPFSLLLPQDEDSVATPVSFDWEDATDPDPGDTVKYDLYVSTSSTFHPDSTTIYGNLLNSEYSTNFEIGTYYWKVRVYDKHAEVWSSQTWNFYVFVRGDANGDGVINIADVVYLLNYLFTGGLPPDPLEAGDANCDGLVNIADVVYLINYLFAGGDPPGC